MARRQRLTTAQIAELFDPPAEQRELVRHFTLSEADLAAIGRSHGDHNRLGHALMLCYLRYPGRALRPGERPPTALLAFVAGQLGVFRRRLTIPRSRAESPAPCRRMPAPARTASVRQANGGRIGRNPLPQAIEDDRFVHLAALVMQTCRQRRIIVPSKDALERLCGALRDQAHREVYRRLAGDLSAEQRRQLDALTQRREKTGQNWLTWLRQMPEAAKPDAMLGLIERLEHVRAIGIQPSRGHQVHQARLAQLVREAGRSTVQHVADHERQRRHATLVAICLDLCANLTDQAVDVFDRLIGALFRKAEGRQVRAFQADARSINNKVRLFARVGDALIAAHDKKRNAFAAIETVIPWKQFCTTIAEAKALARPEAFDAYPGLTRHYGDIRRWSPAFLDALKFESVPASASLLRAIEVLREVNRTEGSTLLKDAPTSFVRQRWVPYVLPGGVIDRRYYEFCVLSELRDRLRAGDVWVVGSRQYRSFEERLLSRETMQNLQKSDTLPIAVEADFDRFIESRLTLLDERLKEVDARAKRRAAARRDDRERRAENLAD